ncbi:MAG: helix-turn-helix domain-containing protein [Verrucomicrobiota bacterium]
MSSVAEQLRQAREAQKLSVEQVAETTKMKSDHVRALEEGNYNVFAAPVYIRGFVRTLCRMFKLDEAQVLCDLDVELSRTEKFKDAPSYSGPPKTPLDVVMYWLTKVKWRIAAPALLGVAVIAGIIWGVRAYHERKNRNPLSNLGSGMYQPATNAVSGELLPLPTNAPAPRPNGKR